MRTGIEEIIDALPLRFRKEKAEGICLVVHFDLTGEEPVQYTVSVADLRCEVEKGFRGKADVLVQADSENYIELELGKLSPQEAILTGKIRVNNISEMIRFVKCFRKYDTTLPNSISNTEEETKSIRVSERKPSIGPLSGIRILDFTRLLPGPQATLMLADMGAEVIKVEDPDSPDDIRNYPPFVEGISALYMGLNRGKKSVGIDYRTEQGKDKILALLPTIDVIIEQFRPGVMKVFGLDYESLKHYKHDLIYCSITGYGQEGTMSDKAGHDLNYIALSGLLSQNVTSDGKSVIPYYQIADIGGGAYTAVIGIQAAIIEREKTGQGRYIDVNMTKSVLPFLTIPLISSHQHNLPRPGGESLSGGRANYQVYATSDGRFMALGALEPKFWDRFCDAVNKMEWKNRITDLGKAMEDLKEEVSQLFLTKTMKEWESIGNEFDCCLTPVLRLDEVIADERKLYRDAFKTDPNLSIRIPYYDRGDCWPAPHLGEDKIS